MNERSRHVGERRRHLDGHVVQLAELNRAWVHHPRTELSQLEHLFVANLRELARIRRYSRISRVDALDVGIDVAALGAKRARQRHRGRVRTAATKRRDVLVVGDALEAGDDDDFALVELVRDALRMDVGDPRPGKHARRANPSLSAGQGHGRLLQLV